MESEESGEGGARVGCLGGEGVWLSGEEDPGGDLVGEAGRDGVKGVKGDGWSVEEEGEGGWLLLAALRVSRGVGTEGCRDSLAEVAVREGDVATWKGRRVSTEVSIGWGTPLDGRWSHVPGWETRGRWGSTRNQKDREDLLIVPWKQYKVGL